MGDTGMKNQVIHFDDDLQAKIEDWRRKQATIPPFSTAVVTLLKEKLGE